MYELKAKQDPVQALQLLYDHSGYATSIIHHIKHHIIPFLPKHRIFLDIGAGPGIITRAISKFFQQTIVFEPLPEFHVYYQSLGMTVISDPYPSRRADFSADFILAAHLLYHIPIDNWAMVIKKMFQQLEPGGSLMIVLTAPRGNWHNLCLQLNPEYPHAGHLEDCLNQLEIPFTKQACPINYTTQSAEELADICRYILNEDCLLNRDLNEEELIELDVLLTNFSQSLKTMRHNYHLRLDDDWFFFQKPL